LHALTNGQWHDKLFLIHDGVAVLPSGSRHLKGKKDPVPYLVNQTVIAVTEQLPRIACMRDDEMYKSTVSSKEL
jgi:hypothetical protein